MELLTRTCLGYNSLLFFSLLLLLSCTKKKQDEISFNIPEGFEIEDLYTPSEHGQGSWVSLAEGPNGKFYASDQYGSIYTFQIPSIGNKLDSEAVDSLNLNIGHAQGLLWAFNSLYVVVVKDVDEEKPNDPSSGIYRLQDSNQDGTLDTSTKILTVSGTGEHGPHTLRISPDGQSLYFIAGNFNKVPDYFKSKLPRTWNEDNLFPQYLDASGHAVDLKAPGGWMAKTDPQGMEWELIGAGMRNPFSFGINEHGDLFAYDADMEWDFGMPWYRPTRILHVTSGSEFGWRTGSGKWPVVYPDNLPAVENMSQGSPTAVIMGKDLHFPYKYRNGLFACDWSFGTIYYVDIQEDGSSYTGKKEEFLSGVPLPITNAIAGSDGHLYFLTGGRGLTSHLFRVRNTQPLPKEPFQLASQEANIALRATRKRLESYHSVVHPEAVATAWKHLNHSDRFIRYAARIALEHQPIDQWESLLSEETDPMKMIQASISYIRSGGIVTSHLLSKLKSAGWEDLNTDNKISKLRAYELFLIRNRDAKESLKRNIASHLSPFFPSSNKYINRSLSQLLLYLNSDDGVEKTMALLEKELLEQSDTHPEILSKKLLERSEQYGPQIADMLDNMPPTEAIHYLTILSHARTGWTRELRTKYFSVFNKALQKKGGVSYKTFLDNIRAEALKKVPEGELAHFKELTGFYSPMTEMANLPKPIGPGMNYNVYDLGRIVVWGNDKLEKYNGSYTDGQRAFDAALCSSCHRMNGEGANAGPDLSNIHTRFNKGEIAKAILSPNEDISDQYTFTQFTLKDDKTVRGRIVSEDDERYTIYQSPYNITATSEILKKDIISKEASGISPMPARLFNPLNEQEVLDLMVYLLSGGKKNGKYY